MLTLLLPGWRRQLRNPGRLLLTLTAISLGAGLATFILLLNRSTVASLESSVESLAADNDLVVKALGGDSFPESALDTVLAVPGISSAVPMLQSRAFVMKDGAAKPVTLLGLDLLNDRSLRKGNGAARRIADPLAFMANPDSVALPRSFAAAHDFRDGGALAMFTAKGTRQYVVRALLADEALGKAFGGSVVVMDLEAARRAYGKEGKIDQINIIAASKRGVPGLTRALQAALGDSFAVEPPSAQVQGLREVVEPFQKVLLFFGALASVLALFLIASAAAVAIDERRAEVGVLRALGSTRRQVLGAIATEFSLIGLAGAGLGSLAAWAFARGSLASLQSGVSSQTQALITLRAEDLDPSIPLAVTAAGAGLTLLAALLPARAIAATPPATAFGALAPGSAPISGGAPGARILSAVGALSLAPLFLPLPGAWSALVGLPVLGAVLFGPRLAARLLVATRSLGEKAAWPSLRLAWGYAVDQPRRIESTVRALVAGLLVVFLITTTQDGFVRSLSQMFLSASRPDFYVSSPGDFLSPMSLQPLDESLQRQLAEVPGVAGVYGQRIVTVNYAGRNVKLSAFDEVPPATLAVPYSYFEVSDRPVAEAGRELYHADFPAAFVSESFATLFGKKTGDDIELRAEARTVKFRIVGLVRDFTAGGGRIYLSRDRYKKLWQDPLVTGIAIVLAKGASLAAVRERVEKRFGPSHGILVTENRSIQGDVERILKKSFANLDAIGLACLLVAALGFLNAFLLAIRARTREISLLRITGMSRAQLSAFLLTEAALIGMAASLVSLALAWPISYRLVRDGLPTLLGWVIDFPFRFDRPLQLLALGLGVSLVASFSALRFARNLDVAEGIKDE